MNEMLLLFAVFGLLVVVNIVIVILETFSKLLFKGLYKLLDGIVSRTIVGNKLEEE